MNPAKKRERVPYVASLHWRYLHLDGPSRWKKRPGKKLLA